MKEIEQIIATYDQWLTQGLPMALASVVRVAGSSYRRIGARMLVRADGQWVGGISGGCLEGDALRRAKAAIHADAPSRIVYDTTKDDADQIGVGLGCQGVIEVLFLPLGEQVGYHPLRQLRQLLGVRSPRLLLQLINGDHQDWLGKLVPAEDSQIFAQALCLAQFRLENIVTEVRESGRSRPYTIPSESGEELEVLIEWVPPKICLLLIGDNYDINAAIRIGKTMGWQVIVCGKKIAFNAFAYQNADQIVPFSKLSEVTIDEYTAVVLMTHDLATDIASLPYLLSAKPKYLGILGPRKRLKRLEEAIGDDLSMKAELYSPVGLDIGAVTPDEIALSMAAEIIAVFRNRTGQSLKYRNSPIHPRD